MSAATTRRPTFREALAAESPLQIVGAINANHALLAKRAGQRAIYLSGGGVAAGSLGFYDSIGYHAFEQQLDLLFSAKAAEK